jgi:hypothetical protein
MRLQRAQRAGLPALMIVKTKKTIPPSIVQLRKCPSMTDQANGVTLNRIMIRMVAGEAPKLPFKTRRPQRRKWQDHRSGRILLQCKLE